MEEMENEIAFSKTEEGRIEAECNKINDYGVPDYTREITPQELKQAWELLRSRKPEMREVIPGYELNAALEELYPDLLRPKRKGVLWHNYCFRCRGQIEIMAPLNPIGVATMEKDLIHKSIECPHCKKQTEVAMLSFFGTKCANCGKQWSVFQSQEGDTLRCENCKQNFVARNWG
jgi:DNA-directed RNA polymerase subunit RPC12/RpoP